MKNGNESDYTEDGEFLASVRQALDVGEVPERLRAAIRVEAERQAFASRRRSFSRMSRWVSGLTTTAAAAIICMYSASQYFGRKHVRYDELQRLDRIIDLVSDEYADGVADESTSVSPNGTLTLDSVTERYSRICSYGDDDEDYYL